MPMMQCNSCGGTYQSVQADGTPYYHACAPLPPKLAHLFGQELANKRDENLVQHPSLFVLEDGREVGIDQLPHNGTPAHRKTSVKAEGAGAVPVPDESTAAVVD